MTVYRGAYRGTMPAPARPFGFSNSWIPPRPGDAGYGGMELREVDGDIEGKAQIFSFGWGIFLGGGHLFFSSSSL